MQNMFNEENNDPELKGGEDIFNLKYIVCPININDNTHWTSAVIFMEDKRIQYYDSKENR
ncbi:hypothetical protein ACHAW5_002127 [Stephanodiscus triporus]|uniref:Ubiquitin-like protease family profile domain-containing protein n=1 Tax=Stephanodiscus triporus TaxID=2934178 RepID=A0ABD3P5R5_9STRA